jgi:hypothetical protein
MIIQVYKYDSEGMYVEPILIETNDDDTYELPKNCTDKELPQPNYKPIFDKELNKWVETITQDELDVLKGNTLDNLKQNKLSELNSSYSIELTSGFTTNATGTPIRFKYGEIDQLNFTKRTNAVALGTSDPSFPFGTADGVFTFTVDQWKLVAKDAENHEMSVYEKLVIKRNEVDVATIDEINNIVW